MFYSHRGGWRWQETCGALTCLWSWWCCAARSCSIRLLLPLLRQSWCGLLLSRCLPCHRVVPRYLKLLTSSNFSLFRLTPALMSFVLSIAILLFSVLSSISCAVALSPSLLVTPWKSILLPPVRSTSSANYRLDMALPPMGMDVWWSRSVSHMMSSRNKLNRMGESRHPWWTLTVVLKNSNSSLFKRTTLLEFSYSAWMAWSSAEWLEAALNGLKQPWMAWSSPSSMLKLMRTCNRPACQTLSNAFSEPLARVECQMRHQCSCPSLRMLPPDVKGTISVWTPHTFQGVWDVQTEIVP